MSYFSLNTIVFAEDSFLNFPNSSYALYYLVIICMKFDGEAKIFKFVRPIVSCLTLNAIGGYEKKVSSVSFVLFFFRFRVR